VSKTFTTISWNQKVHKSPPLVPIPIQSILTYISKIHQYYPPIHVTCPAQFILIDLAILIILVEEYTSYEAPHYAAFSTLLPLHAYSVQISSSAPSDVLYIEHIYLL
jgi:hypothetical protein